MALWKGTWLQQEGEDKHGMNDNNSEDDSDGIRKRVLSISKSDGLILSSNARSPWCTL
ncbi:hypothetical protein NC652_005315 [Populus alba x Populus x berolinensis]|nr:hypothetical protein NC652_005315 [Populus alba x Populus x berolinensis]